MKKKILSLILAMAMVLMLVPVMASAASDISGHWAEETLEKWSDLGWFTGDGAGTYRPSAAVSRAEFMALVNRMKGFTTPGTGIANFSDVRPGAWYYEHVSIALEKGYITGYEDGTVRPEASITRQEAMTIVARLEGVSAIDANIINAASDSGSVASWAKGYVAACIENGLIAGAANRINPGTNITRAETVVLLDRVYSNERTYAFAGKYGPETGALDVAKVTVAGSGVRLHNMKVAGDLNITKAVGEGDVWLENLDISGTLDIAGGGINSIHISNCHIKNIVIDKDYVRVIFDNGTTIEFLRVVGAHDILEFLDGSEVTSITITTTATGTEIEMEEGTVIGEITINAPTTISGEGTINVANIKSDGVEIEQEPDKVNIDEGVTAIIAGEEVGGTPSSGGGGAPGGSDPNTPPAGVTITCVPDATKKIITVTLSEAATVTSLTLEEKDIGTITTDFVAQVDKVSSIVVNVTEALGVGKYTIKITLEGGKVVTGTFEIKGDGGTEPTEYNVQYNLTGDVTKDGPDKVVKDGKLSATLQVATPSSLPAAITVTMGGTTLVVGTGYTYDKESGAVVIEKVIGDVVITADGVPGGGEVVDTLAVTSVTLSETSPKVGDEIETTVAMSDNAAAGDRVEYQWQVETATDTYVDIADATSASYTATIGNVGKKLQVIVSVKDQVTGAKTSAPTAAVIEDTTGPGTDKYNVTYTLTEGLTHKDGPDEVVKDGALSVILEAGTGKSLPLTITVTMGGALTEGAEGGYTYNVKTGAVAIAKVTADVVITAVGANPASAGDGEITDPDAFGETVSGYAGLPDFVQGTANFNIMFTFAATDAGGPKFADDDKIYYTFVVVPEAGVGSADEAAEALMGATALVVEEEDDKLFPGSEENETYYVVTVAAIPADAGDGDNKAVILPFNPFGEGIADYEGAPTFNKKGANFVIVFTYKGTDSTGSEFADGDELYFTFVVTSDPGVGDATTIAEGLMGEALKVAEAVDAPFPGLGIGDKYYVVVIVDPNG